MSEVRCSSCAVLLGKYVKGELTVERGGMSLVVHGLGSSITIGCYKCGHVNVVQRAHSDVVLQRLSHLESLLCALRHDLAAARGFQQSMGNPDGQTVGNVPYLARASPATLERLEWLVREAQLPAEPKAGE